MAELRNYCFDELSVGQQAQYSREISEQDIQMFAAISGDANPVHLDADFAATTAFGEPIAHGMLTGALVSASLAMVLPGPGTIYRSQTLRFRAPVKIGDELTVKLEVAEKAERQKKITLDCAIYNQHEKLVASGVAEVIAPPESLRLQVPELPRFTRVD